MRIIAVGLAALILLAAFSVAARSPYDDVWRRAEACLNDGDTAVCWLRISAPLVGPRLLRLDPDIYDRPEVLEALGLAPRSPTAPRSTEPHTDRDAAARRARERKEATLQELVVGDPALTAMLASPAALAAYDPAAEHRRVGAERWDRLISSRMTLMGLAQQTGRTALADGSAAVVFQMGMLGQDELLDSAGIRHSLAVLTPSLSPDELATRAAQVEAAARARGGLGVQNMLPAAHDAWVAAGQPERAEALISDWSPLARAQHVAFRTGHDPDGVLPDGQPDALQGLQAILVAQGRDTEAEALGWLSPAAGISQDFETGEGAKRLDQRLEGRSEGDRRRILVTCISLATGSLDTESAEVCGLQLLDMTGPWDQRLFAAEQVMSAAGVAARLDQGDRTDRLTRRALAIGAQAERERPADAPTISSSPGADLVSVATLILRQRPPG